MICSKWLCGSAIPGDDADVLGTLGLLLTTVTSAPVGMVGFPSVVMGMLVVPAESLVTTTIWPAVFVKVACAPLPVRTAAVGCPSLPVTNCTDEEVVPAAHMAQTSTSLQLGLHSKVSIHQVRLPRW